MKAQNKEEKLAKQQEREKLQREIAARERAERIQAEYEERLRALQVKRRTEKSLWMEFKHILKSFFFLWFDTLIPFLKMYNYVHYSLK